MANHQLASLIKMANQIAANNAHVGSDDEVAKIIAGHMQKFWARSMKQQIRSYLEETTEGNELSPEAQSAVLLLK
ncbi:formate dehydrogenase subunit delta [Neptuniibacter halophilus]|uniref:formate dehydrogenase subunit delta n=1 Tax=Neptuniibacter halophilus TaxID=651666 RepID=UPI0025726C45|nr:formate dehydrogenase subunit delta [Neptuniibacter halophilus]